MTLLSAPAIPLGRRPSPASTTPATSARPRRLLAVVLEPQDVESNLPIASHLARESGRELHVAVLVPRPPFTLDAALFARLAESSDRQAAELVTLAGLRTAGSEVRTRLTLHLLRGLDGPRRQHVVDRAVARLARRLDAELAPRVGR